MKLTAPRLVARPPAGRRSLRGCSADNEVMSAIRTYARPASVGRSLLVLAGCLLAGACESLETELPPVRTPLGVHLACQPPQLSPISPITPPPGWSCGLRDLECDERRPLVVRVDEHAQLLEAYIPGTRSPELDACILKELRVSGWRFEPARECNGDPLAGDYVEESGIVCGHASSRVTGGRTRG